MFFFQPYKFFGIFDFSEKQEEDVFLMRISNFSNIFRHCNSDGPQRQNSASSEDFPDFAAFCHSTRVNSSGRAPSAGFLLIEEHGIIDFVSQFGIVLGRNCQKCFTFVFQ